jgi:hypothetical protein
MSAIASFTLLPKSTLPGLREAAVPTRFGGNKQDDFWPYVYAHGRKLKEYKWSGYFFGTLLPYLEEKRAINFSSPDFEETGSFLSNVRAISAYILTEVHRQAKEEDLDPDTYSEEELRAYFEAFNETTNEEAGRAMLDGIAVLHENLSHVDKDSVVLLMIV